jgi:hypothetical protein
LAALIYTDSKGSVKKNILGKAFPVFGSVFVKIRLTMLGKRFSVKKNRKNAPEKS